jgi:MoxR-like ATPase
VSKKQSNYMTSVNEGFEEARKKLEKKQVEVREENVKLEDLKTQQTKVQAELETLETSKAEVQAELESRRDEVRRCEKVLEDFRESKRERGQPGLEITKREKWNGEDEAEAVKYVYDRLDSAGRVVRIEELVALHTAFKTAPFTVLSGPSGAGKTSLVRAYSEAFGIFATQIPVQPGWTSVADLHGYAHPLSREYKTTPFFTALSHQAQTLMDGDTPLKDNDRRLDVALLDEINLSHVEYFLADYLSAFETTDRKVSLAGRNEVEKIDPELEWLFGKSAIESGVVGVVEVPHTFLMVGTANEDHTTREFSDKFRDRAAFLNIQPPDFQSIDPQNLFKPTDTIKSDRYVPRSAWNAWRERKKDAKVEKKILEMARKLSKLKGLSPSVRVLRGAADFATHATPLLEHLREYLEDPSTDIQKIALDLAIATRVAHKYAAWTDRQWKLLGVEREKVREVLVESAGGDESETARVFPGKQ